MINNHTKFSAIVHYKQYDYTHHSSGRGPIPLVSPPCNTAMSTMSCGTMIPLHKCPFFIWGSEYKAWPKQTST